MLVEDAAPYVKPISAAMHSSEEVDVEIIATLFVDVLRPFTRFLEAASVTDTARFVRRSYRPQRSPSKSQMCLTRRESLDRSDHCRVHIDSKTTRLKSLILNLAQRIPFWETGSKYLKKRNSYLSSALKLGVRSD